MCEIGNINYYYYYYKPWLRKITISRVHLSFFLYMFLRCTNDACFTFNLRYNYTHPHNQVSEENITVYSNNNVGVRVYTTQKGGGGGYTLLYNSKSAN